MSTRIALNRQLTLETPQQTADGAGGFTTSWITAGQLWANVAARSGRDATAGNVALSNTAYRITVRAAPNGAPSRPTPSQRFRDGSRIFRIDAVAERDSTHRFLTCFCEEEIAQ